jgi:hypothetical protein
MTDAVKVLMAKKEVTYATDSAPTLAANAILTSGFSAKPIEGDRLDRNLDARTYGATAALVTNERQTTSFQVEMAGSGAAGTAPAWMELLEACGMAPAVITAATKAEQRFALPTATPGSLTQHHWIGDQLRKSVGNRGNFSLNMTAGQYPRFSLNYIGLIPAATPFSVSTPGAATLTRWKDPLEVNNVNTALTLDGFAAVMRSLQIDANVPLVMRNLVGARYIRRGNHAASARLRIEAPSIATKDYITTLRTNARVPLLATHGVAAGTITEISAPKAQLLAIDETEEDGVQMWDLDLLLTIDAGQDDLILTAK